MAYLAAILGGYLMGCSNMALYLGKLKGVDLRSGGSGNLGASNATILLGWWAGALTAVHDIGKSLLAVLLAALIFPGSPYIGPAAGVGCVMGHMFPFYLKFKGGKGFASYIGMILALNWKFALVILVLVVAVTFLTDYIVAGTTLTILASPVYFGVTAGLATALILTAATLVILWQHRMNYVRIFNGTELGLRGAVRGDNRVK